MCAANIDCGRVQCFNFLNEVGTYAGWSFVMYNTTDYSMVEDLNLRDITIHSIEKTLLPKYTFLQDYSVILKRMLQNY